MSAMENMDFIMHQRAGTHVEAASPSLASPFSGHVGVKPQPEAEASSSAAYCGATLVVCPLVAVIQWRQEIARFTAAGTVKVRSPSWDCLRRLVKGQSPTRKLVVELVAELAQGLEMKFLPDGAIDSILLGTACM